MTAPRLDSTIVKAFNLIEFLADNDEAMGVSAIAQNFGWQKSNVHRLLTTLKSLGYVRQDRNSRYELSLKTWELGMRVVGRSSLKRCAQPFMRMLNQKYSENISLTILVGTDVLYLDNIPSPLPTRNTVSQGSRVPAAFTASGQALLAYHQDAEAIVRKTIEAHAAVATRGAAEIIDELEKIRSRGYAISHSGWRKGVTSVAAAVLNRSGRSVAALSVNGPTDRLPERKLPEIAVDVIDAAHQISEILGEGST